MSDLRYAVRQLRRRPGFTAVAVLILALAVGGNTAVFSVVESVLLRSLPYPEPERLVVVRATNLARGPEPFLVSPPDFRVFREAAGAFQQLAAWVQTDLNAAGDGAPARLPAARVTPALFEVLGVRPVAGRTFAPEEETFGRHRVAVISEPLWRERYGEDAPGDLTVRLDGEAYTVVGVMPDRFAFPAPETDVWIPLASRAGDPLDTRGNYFLNVVGRLAPASTLGTARTELQAIARQVSREHAEASMTGVALLPLHEVVIGAMARPLLVLLAAMGVVLLVACANLGNLLFVRGLTRHRELAIRTALGAERGRIARQVLAEGAVLGLLGGAAGLLVGMWGVQMLKAIAPPDLPRLTEIAIRPSVFLFGLAVTGGTILLAGLPPALRVSRLDTMNVLRASDTGAGQGGAGGRRRHGRLLVSGQVALTLVLLAGAGLLTRSLLRTLDVETGYRARGLLTASVNLPPAVYPAPTDGWGFFDALLERVRALPGVRSAAVTSGLSLQGGNWTKLMTLADRPLPSTVDDVPVVAYRLVSPEYFRTMGIAIRRGRPFTEADREAGGAAVINQALAERYWPEGDPIGKTIWMGAPEALLADLLPAGYTFPRLEVIGIAASERSTGLDQPVRPEAYQLYTGSIEWPVTMFLTVRTAGPPSGLVGPVRRAVAELDPQQPLADVATMEQLVDRSVASRRFTTGLLGLFAVLALTLAAVGIYGTLAQQVAQRRREIGIRTALGADRSRTLALVLRQGLAPVIPGLIVGLAGALTLTRFLGDLLFSVAPFDLPTYAGVIAVLVTAALVACWIPGYRATRVDPMEVLRDE